MSPFIRPTLMSFAAFCSLATAGCAGGTELEVDGVSRAEQALASLPTLGAASSFAVLANQAVTCTDASIIGNVGTDQATPTGSVTQTNCPVIGAVEVGTLASRAAYASFLTAYDALEAQPCDRYLTGTLAGVILAPGTYCFTATATLTGTLTLDGPSTASWLFKVGTLGTGALTGTSFNVQMANGGSACNVSWWVAEAATITDSNFVGNLFAGAGDTVTRGTFEGRTFSKADVTLTGAAMVGCVGGIIGGGPGDLNPPKKAKCNQGVGNGAEGCDPGNSNHNQPSNDETGGTPGKPGRKP